MTNQYKTSRPAQSWRKLALAALLAGGATAAQAQGLDYGPSGAQNVAGTYTDLGTTGTAITMANNDDANSAILPIGFSFTFNSTAFTDFTVNTNGFIKLGTTPISAANITNYIAAPDLNIIAPLGGIDLAGALNQTTSPTEFRVATTGTAGSRVCTIQWENLADKTAQFATVQFQVKLYEGTNNIEFVYGAWTAGTAAPLGVGFIVGLKGSSFDLADRLFAQKSSSSAAWTTTFFATDSNGGISPHFVRNTFLPDAGRTYRFRPLFANDAAVAAIYTLGKLPIPIATPHVIQAVVRNAGSGAMTNVPVTVTVTGANTFTSTKTIASLARNASATVSFDAFTPTATGNETVTVTLGNDDGTGNNTQVFQQTVNATTYAASEPGRAPYSSIGLNVNTTPATAGSGILAVKYNTNASRLVTDVTVRLGEANSASLGRTVYGVVCNSDGMVVGRTPDYVITTADLSTFKTFTLPSPVNIAAGDFYVGLAQAASPAGTAAYYPVGLQTESPTRPGTFYIMNDLMGGAPTDVAASNLGRFMIEAVTAPLPTCLTPTDVTVTSTNSVSATVSFTGPTNGTAYTIIYGPTGFNPATGGTSVTTATSPYTITGLSGSTVYQVYIRVNCGATDQSTLAGPFSVTTLCTPPVITTYPYDQNFDNIAAGTVLPCGITVTDANADGNTWTADAYVNGSVSTPNAMVYLYNENDATKGGDDWFFTPALFMRAGSSYQLTFKYSTAAEPSFVTSEKMEVKYGNSATPAAQTNLLWKNENITNTSFVTTTAGTSATQVMPISPATNGNVFIGFHAISAPDQLVIFVDDVTVASVVTGVSDALLRAVSVFPNPSAGEFTVDVRGANAKGAMQVEVTNLLGQRVHTATIRDNFENKLNLSALSNGMYTLKVKSGNEFMIRNIVVQK